jgi:hypothetical protein
MHTWDFPTAIFLQIIGYPGYIAITECPICLIALVEETVAIKKRTKSNSGPEYAKGNQISYAFHWGASHAFNTSTNYQLPESCRSPLWHLRAYSTAPPVKRMRILIGYAPLLRIDWNEVVNYGRSSRCSIRSAVLGARVAERFALAIGRRNRPHAAELSIGHGPFVFPI